MTLPVSGWRVRVSGEAATTDCRVAQAEPERLIVRMPTRARDAFRLGESVRVEWVTERGIHIRKGRVVFETTDRAPSLGILMADSQASRRQRRGHVRAPMCLPTLVSREGSSAVAAGESLDVSGGGVRARVPLDLAPGERVLLTLALPSGDVGAGARVVRAEHGTVAFEFLDLPDADRERIVAAVFQRLRTLTRVRVAEG